MTVIVYHSTDRLVLTSIYVTSLSLSVHMSHLSMAVLLSQHQEQRSLSLPLIIAATRSPPPPRQIYRSIAWKMLLLFPYWIWELDPTNFSSTSYGPCHETFCLFCGGSGNSNTNSSWSPTSISHSWLFLIPCLPVLNYAGIFSCRSTFIL